MQPHWRLFMQRDKDFDFSKIDPRFLSPEQWTAVRTEIFRRARRERDEAISIGIGAALDWIRRGMRRLLKWSALRAAWISLVRKRREHIAAARLRALNDRWLADMGLTRGEIERRVRYRARRVLQKITR
jgi:hypothetical protein